MHGDGIGLWRSRLVIAIALLLGACSHQDVDDVTSSPGANIYPANYKTDILAAMHAYLNDPTGVRDAALAPPELKPATMSMPARYVACLRFNAKKNANGYAGPKEIAALFGGGRFDQFVDNPSTKELCAAAAYAPFPELEQLSR
jgi:hypothetical protein